MPREVDELTLAEVSLALDADDDEARPIGGGRQLATHEVEEYARRWRSMTPRERIAHARSRGGKQ